MKFGVLMDPIGQINPHKDTSFALLLAAQARGDTLYYLLPHDLWLQDGLIWGRMQRIRVVDDDLHWYELQDPIQQPLNELDVLVMRKDPPFDMHYIYLTHLLEQAQSQGLTVLNDPRSLRDANEKLFTAWFPQCCPTTLVSADRALLQDFAEAQGHIVVKPLDGMGGGSIFQLRPEDPNLSVILETMTDNGQRLVMAQSFIPAISAGDKRILLINGEPVPYALARIPAPGDFRGNLARGATAQGRELTDRDRWICEQVGPTLRDKGLYFVGLDVIGDYLTEINVTSPTGVRELDRFFQLDIGAEFLAQMPVG